VFSKQLYVHKGTKGWKSIKDVVPVVVTELSYADFVLRDGGAASQICDKITSKASAASWTSSRWLPSGGFFQNLMRG
jgi:hypothetical protein